MHWALHHNRKKTELKLQSNSGLSPSALPDQYLPFSKELIRQSGPCFSRISHQLPSKNQDRLLASKRNCSFLSPSHAFFKHKFTQERKFR